MSSNTPDLKAGDRVELVYTNDPYTRLRPGTLGTIQKIWPGLEGEITYWMKWDDGSTLTMIPDSGDRIRKVER